MTFVSLSPLPCGQSHFQQRLIDSVSLVCIMILFLIMRFQAEILVIGNPWPGKSAITVASDDIIAKETTMDELDNGHGVEVGRLLYKSR